jgi:hypothetical protein
MKYISIITILFLLLISACGSPQSTVRFEKIDVTTLDIDTWETFDARDFTTAYAIMDTIKAAEFAKNQVQKKGVEALSFVMNGELSKAADLYASIIPENDTFNFFWKYFPRYFYSQNHQWEKLKKYEIELQKIDKKQGDKLFYEDYYDQKELIISQNSADTIPLVIDNALPFIKIVINGKTYWFIVDTGCQFSTLFKNVAKNINATELIKVFSGAELEKHHIEGTGVTGNFTALPGILDELKLHNTVFSNLPILIMHANSISVNILFFNLAQVDGIIGWDILQHFDFTIDYKNKKLILKQPIKKENNKRNLFWYEMPIVKFYAGEKNFPLFFIFDSGANVTDIWDSPLLDDVFNRNDDKNKYAEKIYGAGGDGSAKREYSTISQIKLTNITENNSTSFTLTNCHLTPFEGFNKPILLHGNIGSNYFNSKSVHIDILNGIFEILE